MRTFVTTGAIGRMGGNQPISNSSTEASVDAAFAELEASVDRLKKAFEVIDFEAIAKAVAEGLAPLIAKIKADNTGLVEALNQQQRQKQRRENFARYVPPSDDDSEAVRVANAGRITQATRNGFKLPKGD